MEPTSDCYNAYFEQNTSYPNSYINRTEWIGPLAFSYQDTEIQEMLSNAEACITAEASFVEGEEKIKVVCCRFLG